MFFTTEDTNRLYNKSLTDFTEGRAQRGLKILEKGDEKDSNFQKFLLPIFLKYSILFIMSGYFLII